MKSLLPLLSASVVITGISLQALAETDTYTVEGMHCSSCKKIITQKVCNDSTLKTQFESCKVELTDHKKQIGQITITTKKDVKVDPAQIEKAVKAAGDEYKIINTQVKVVMAYEKVQNLLWLDMEMTGLDVNKEVVIEVACIVTDMNFKELDVFETVVKQPQSYLDNMDAWNKDHHGKSGLTARKVPNGMDPDFVEAKMIDLINKHFPDSMTDLKKRPILAGNSIMQDRLFIDKYFKKLSSRLHYRMVDVSSFKIMLNNKYNLEYRKQNSHRALDDIRESIGELKFYLNSIQKN